MNESPVATVADPTSSLPVLAQLARGPRARRALTAYAVAMTAIRATRTARGWWQNKFAYTISVRSTSDIYHDVHARLSAFVPETDRRALTATTMRGGHHLRRGMLQMSPSSEERPDPTRLVTFYDADTAQTINLDGHKIIVSVERESLGLEQLTGDRYHQSERLKFVTRSQAGRDAVLAFLTAIAESRDEIDAPRFFIMSRWGGGWDRRNDLEPRTLDSVVLRAGQIEALVADISQFLGWRDEYMRFGIPYHRGYLFHGPPGTGKTSLARALAAHFGLDVYYAPLSDLDKDTNLLHLVASVKAGSVLLLEDIDVLHAATHRDDEQGISLSGLLNALDGVSTPSGIITVMTTNHPEVLDDAVVRPGRVDRSEAIGYLDDDQLARLVSTIVGRPVTFPSLRDADVAPAEILELIKRSMHDPAEAFADIDMLIKERSA